MLNIDEIARPSYLGMGAQLFEVLQKAMMWTCCGLMSLL